MLAVRDPTMAVRDPTLPVRDPMRYEITHGTFLLKPVIDRTPNNDNAVDE